MTRRVFGLAFNLISMLQAGRGRWLSLALLGIACIALPRFEDSPLRNAQFSLYQQWEPRPRLAKPAVVVAIDSQSIQKFGQWPWPRDLVARLVERVQAHHPKAIGIDILFAEPDRYSRQALTERFPELSESEIKRLPDPDQALARALAAAPVTLAVVGVNNRLTGAGLPTKSPAIRDGDKILDLLPRYESALVSLPLLARAAHSEGLLNGPQDALSTSQERGVMRRVPAIAVIDFIPLLSLPLEMVRRSFGKDGSVAVDASAAGIERIWVGGYSIPTTPQGEIVLHFGPPQSDYYLSAADVLQGNFPPDAFADRFVFFGFTAVALQDRIVTPLGDNLPGIDVHVQALESLLTGEALRRPAWIRHSETGLLVFWGLLLIVAVPVLRRPRYAALAMLLISALTVGSGYLLFHFFRLLFDGPSVIYLLAPVFISLLSSALITADRQRRQAERELQLGREAAAHTAGELDAARRIQMGLLPNPAEVFSGETRFEVAALLEAARSVGGDYYDCFALDEHRLYFAVGDVSGKGVQASLFMAMSKTVSGALARRNADLGQVMSEVGIELSRNNPEYLFVTAFVGVLDADTGQLEFVCAGHDAPILQRGENITHLRTREVAGPPLCAVGDYPFASARLQLQPGDTLCLFTDGVTEAGGGGGGSGEGVAGERVASNADARLFGSTRLEAALAASPATAPVAERLADLRRSIRDFEGDRPLYDDLTLLLVRFNGR